MAKSLHCSPETVTILLVNWLYSPKLKVLKNTPKNRGKNPKVTNSKSSLPNRGWEGQITMEDRYFPKR